MRKKWEVICLVLLLFLPFLLVSCSMLRAPEKSAPAGEYLESSSDQSTAERDPITLPARVGEEAERKVIKNADLEIEVENASETVDRLEQLAEDLEGIVAEANIYNVGQSQQQASVILRIPAKNFHAALSAIEETGELLHKRTYTDDVTMEYIDREARIRNLEAQEERYCELLEEAESVEEMLQVERELERIRGELEAQIGQFNYLKDRVDYGTITISIKEVDPQTAGISQGFAGLGKRVANAFVRNTNYLLDALTAVIIFLIGGLPILIPVAIIVFLLYKGANWLKKRRSGKPPVE